MCCCLPFVNGKIETYIETLDQKVEYIPSLCVCVCVCANGNTFKNSTDHLLSLHSGHFSKRCKNIDI